MSSSPLQTLLDRHQLWRAGLTSAPDKTGLHTGFAALDAALHLGGWPPDGSTELLCDQLGIGELWLLLPSLAERSQHGPIAWINPPCTPNLAAWGHNGLAPHRQLLVTPQLLADQLWAAEEILRSGVFTAVLSWFSCRELQDRQLRRLQVAAKEGQCWHLHFRPSHCAQQTSPAPLRLQLAADADNLQLRIIKQPGGPAAPELLLARPKELYHRQRPVRDWPSFTSVDLAQHSNNQRRLRLIPTLRPAQSTSTRTGQRGVQ